MTADNRHIANCLLFAISHLLCAYLARCDEIDAALARAGQIVRTENWHTGRIGSVELEVGNCKQDDLNTVILQVEVILSNSDLTDYVFRAIVETREYEPSGQGAIPDRR